MPARLPALGQRLSDRLRRFPAATSGLAAVEFALLIPVMAVIAFGLSDATTGLIITRKLTNLSRSLADLTSRVPTMTTTEMENIFNASTSILQPFSDTELQMQVTSVAITKVNDLAVGTVDWSCSRNVQQTPSGAPPTGFYDQNIPRRPKGTRIPVPAGYENMQSFVYVETLRPYKPTVGYVLTGTFHTKLNTPWPVRNVSQVTAPSSCPVG